jgi:hypothetical protein
MSQQKRRFEASVTPSVPKTKPLSAPGRLGMVFANVEELRKAIDAYNIRERRQL